MVTILAVDVGLTGAAFVGRVLSLGPEAVCPPIRWNHSRRAAYERAKPNILDNLTYMAQRWGADYLALEEAISIMGRRKVGVSQAWLGAEIAIAVGLPLIKVPGQGAETAVKAWAVLRQSFSEIVLAEEMRELNGPAGEHCRDAAAIFLSSLSRLTKNAVRGTIRPSQVVE